jgi:hypothetical protein
MSLHNNLKTTVPSEGGHVGNSRCNAALAQVISNAIGQTTTLEFGSQSRCGGEQVEVKVCGHKGQLFALNHMKTPHQISST